VLTGEWRLVTGEAPRRKEGGGPASSHSYDRTARGGNGRREGGELTSLAATVPPATSARVSLWSWGFVLRVFSAAVAVEQAKPARKQAERSHVSGGEPAPCPVPVPCVCVRPDLNNLYRTGFYSAEKN
jgi:hypothetical protein